ncbi:hypothetical protein [Ramlibacter sp.]|uniref:hypothetical protein n=1 Tax=Ramlibacter sp. TaxID=1917967 RepID=UPI0035B33272
MLMVAASLLAPAQAREAAALPAGARCGPAGADGGRHCAIGWTEDRMRNLWQPQEETNWCWAAAISMLFSASGLVMSQAGIVERQYGAPLDEPEHMADVLDLLGRAWSDAQGNHFHFITALAGRYLDLRDLAAPLLADMSQGRPWLIFHARHVVLLARVTFEFNERTGRMRIVGGSVLDPNPGEGVRALRADEWVPRYAVRVRVHADND